MPVRQGFNIAEGAPEMGRFTVKLKPDAPGGWRSTAISGLNGLFFDTVCITPARIRDSGLTRSTVLSKAVFSGLVAEAECGSVQEPWSLSGPSLVAWLGNADNPSIGPTGFTSAGSVSLASFLASLFGGGTPAGKYVNGLQLYSAATCDTNSITDAAALGETARELIDRWCRQTTNPTEWWVRPDGQAHFAIQGNSAIFTQTPTVLFGRDIESGTYGGYNCYRIGTGQVRYSSQDYANAVILYDGASSTEQTINSTYGTFDPSVQMMTTGSIASDTTDGGNLSAYYRADGGTYEALFLLEYRHKNGAGATRIINEDWRTRTITVDAPGLPAVLKPGDFCYFYDPDTYATDTIASNEVTINGRLMHPVAVRVASMDWPILPGMGVYLISNGSGDALDGSGAYNDFDTVTDLSDYVLYDSGPARVDFNTNPPSVRKATHTFQRKEANTASWR